METELLPDDEMDALPSQAINAVIDTVTKARIEARHGPKLKLPTDGRHRRSSQRKYFKTRGLGEKLYSSTTEIKRISHSYWSH